MRVYRIEHVLNTRVTTGVLGISRMHIIHYNTHTHIYTYIYTHYTYYTIHIYTIHIRIIYGINLYKKKNERRAGVK